MTSAHLPMLINTVVLQLQVADSSIIIIIIILFIFYFIILIISVETSDTTSVIVLSFSKYIHLKSSISFELVCLEYHCLCRLTFGYSGRVEVLWMPWINPNILHLGVKLLGLLYWNWDYPQIKSQGVVMLKHDRFKSQHCLTIQ